MKFSLAISVTIASTLMFASGCASQTAAKQQTQTANQETTQQGTEGQGSSAKTEQHPGLLDPSKAVEKAPEKYQVKFSTTKGDFIIDVTRKWSPNGADRFYNLVKIGYFKDIAIFRAIKGFMFQFGIHGDPAVSAKWSNSNINDDASSGISNKKGYITFAKTGRPNSRSTQIFINLGNNAGLDSQGFTPFGQVTSGMDVVEKINTEYGENPRGEGVQGKFEAQGNAYIMKRFPNIDVIKSATLIENK